MEASYASKPERVQQSKSATHKKSESKYEEIMEEFLDRQIEQLSKQIDVSERSSRFMLYGGFSAVFCGMVFTVYVIILFLLFPLSTRSVGTVGVGVLVGVGTLVTIGGTLFILRAGEVSAQVRSTFLDELLELEKLSQAVNFLSTAKDEAKDHLRELLVLKLLNIRPEQEKTKGKW